MPIKFRSELVQCRPVARFSTLDGRGHFSILSSLDHDHLQLWVCGCSAPEPCGVSHVPGLAQGNIWPAPSASGMCNLTPDRATDRLFGFRQKIPHRTERTYIDREITCATLRGFVKALRIPRLIRKGRQTPLEPSDKPGGKRSFRMMSYGRTDDILSLVFAMQGSATGISLVDMQRIVGCSRRTAERLRDAALRAFPQIEELTESDDGRANRWHLPSGSLDRLLYLNAEELLELRLAADTLRHGGLG